MGRAVTALAEAVGLAVVVKQAMVVVKAVVVVAAMVVVVPAMVVVVVAGRARWRSSSWSTT